MFALLLGLTSLLAAPPAHWVTRDFQIYCGKPGSDRLADYNKWLDPDLAKRLVDLSWDPRACVESAKRRQMVLAELSLLVDHFGGWGITPNLAVFGEGPGRYHRLYVRPIDAVAMVRAPSPREIPLAKATLSVHADPQKAFGPSIPMDGVRYILAHELTHALQRSSAVYRQSPPASTAGEEAAWISEGMADAVGLDWLARRADGAIRPAGMSTMVHTPVGIRPYHKPLPITDDRLSTTRDGVRAAKEALYDYRTSSFWRYLLERLGGRDPAWFGRMLRHPAPRWPDGKRTHWIAWLDGRLRQQSGWRLSDAYGAFLPEFLSWGFSRYAGWGFTGPRARAPAYRPAQWLERGFGGCPLVVLGAGATTRIELKLAAMSGRCVFVAASGPRSSAVGLDIIAAEQPETVAEGLTLGLGHVIADSTWNCYRAVQRRARPDCRIGARTLPASAGKARRTWTVQPHPVDREGRAFFYLTLASFPDSADKRWLDRTDTIRLDIGLRAVRLTAQTPTTRPAQRGLAGPLSAAMTGTSNRGVRPGLPVAAAEGIADPVTYLASILANPAALGTTGLTAAQADASPAGLPGLAVYGWRDGEPTPDQVHMVVFEQPLPLGFEGRAAAALSSNLDPGAAPPRLGWPAKREAIPVDVSFTRERLAMRFESPLCIADLGAIGGRPSATDLAQSLCADRGRVAADIALPFGEYYVVGSAPALDPDAVRLPPDERPGGPPANAPTEPDASAPGGGPLPSASGGTIAPCACTCARLARQRDEMEAVAREAQAILTALSPEDLERLAESGEDPLPPELLARMAAADAFGPCLDRCAEVFDRCD